MQNIANVNHFDTTRPNDGKQHDDYTIPRMNIPRMKGRKPGDNPGRFRRVSSLIVSVKVITL